MCFSSVAAAIKASLAETLDGGEADSSDGSDLETFTDDDNTNNSFEIKRKVANGRYCWYLLQLGCDLSLPRNWRQVFSREGEVRE